MTNESSTSEIASHLVLPLPGGLDDKPFFNSNSPELVLESGILLSTFPSSGTSCPAAHLDYAFNGLFDVFFHHVTNSAKAIEQGTAYVALLVGNNSDEPVDIEVLKGSIYVTRPDAPFMVLDHVLENADGKIFAGPSDRVMLDNLLGLTHSALDKTIKLAPGEKKLICCVPLPVGKILHQSNGCSSLISLRSTGPVNLATLSCFQPHTLFAKEEPSLNTWLEILENGALAKPRDKQPTVLGAGGELIYGRVAGVASGSSWRGTIANDAASNKFLLVPGEIVSYPIATVLGGTLGTNQIQSADLLVRYSDTAYQAHGNYGVLYDLHLPVHNQNDFLVRLGLSFQSPLKNWNRPNSLKFLKNVPEKIVFRGSLKAAWNARDGSVTKVIHIAQNQGQAQTPFLDLAVKPGETIDINIELYYPGDCTPPHVLTISAIRE